MAAALFRGGTGLCVRCIHRELCRLVWRPQTAMFSSKPSDRKQPRRTHIKKAKPQPAVDVAALLEQLFSQSRPGTAPPAGKARPAKASSMPTKAPTTSSVKLSTSNVPPLSKADPAVSVVPAASSFNQVDSVSKTTSSTLNTAPLSPRPESASPTKTSCSLETPQEQTFAADSAVESLIEITSESPVESSISPEETLEVRAAVVEGPVEPPIDVVAAETKSKDSGVVTVEPSLETAVEPSVEALETLESRAVVVEHTVDAHGAQTNSTDSGPVELSIETTVEPAIELSISKLEENRAAFAEGLVETTIETEAVSDSYGAKAEPLIETTIEPAVEVSASSLGSGPAASEGTVEATIETKAAHSLSHAALIQNAQESAPLLLKNESESTIEGVKKSEQMTLESVTLHVVQVQVESLKTDELLQTKSVLDEKAEKEQQEFLIQAGSGAEAAAETERSSEDEGEILTEALSKWDSLSEDLQELEGESGSLVAELLCRVSKTPGISSDPPAGANGDSVQTEEKEAEAMTLESVTLANVKAEVGRLEDEVLLETRNELEKEAEVHAKEEEMEVTTAIEDVFEDTTEAEMLSLESISKATDAIEAETSVILEAMFGSEQGPKQPDEGIGQEAEKASGEQEGALEAMTLESVTLAEVEASLGSLENVSLVETMDYLEKEAEIIAGEKKVEVEDVVESEETTEDLKMESLSLPEGDVFSEALQTDELMEELLFTIPGHVTEDCQEDQRADIMNDLDPVQRLFLEKIREYNNMRRANGGALEAEPHYEKHLSEETAKLQRLYGGGDLSSFPEFTFTEPKMDQDSK